MLKHYIYLNLQDNIGVRLQGGAHFIDKGSDVSDIQELTRITEHIGSSAKAHSGIPSKGGLFSQALA